jgi:hypothetical protein
MQPVEETFRGMTPLHLAAAAKWPEGVALLLAAGADRYAKDYMHSYPIHVALATGCSVTVDLLLDGDCRPYFTRQHQHQPTTIPWFTLYGMVSSNKRIQNALIGAFVHLRNSSGALRPYRDLSLIYHESGIDVADSLFSGGFLDLESRDDCGKTPLMWACSRNHHKFAAFLLEKGANLATPHRDSNITAGYFLSADYNDSSSFLGKYSKLYTNLLHTAFSIADTVESRCVCSPDGYTPVAALSQSRSRRKRRLFEGIVSCLQWPTYTVEEQARAFALGEIFNRLGMTHTCINIHYPSRKFPEEDRTEIECEEQEFSNQLQELMKEYDSGCAEFCGGPLDYLGFFFKRQELSLPSVEECWWETRDKRNENDKDLLGPGTNYQSGRFSFTGEVIFNGHREQAIEENMLDLLFAEDQSQV